MVEIEAEAMNNPLEVHVWEQVRMINPVTRKFVSFLGLPETDEQAWEVVSSGVSRTLYGLHRAMGKSVADAILATLEAGERASAPQ